MKRLVTLLLAAALLLPFNANAQVASTVTGTFARVEVYDTNVVIAYLAGNKTMCAVSGTPKPYAYFHASTVGNEAYKTFVSVATAAFLAGAQVELSVIQQSDYCRIKEIRLIK